MSVLFIEERRGWSAQCLEYDIATQAKSLQGLFYEVERTLVSYLALADEAGEEPFAGLPKAPSKYWKAFERARTRMERQLVGLKSKKSGKPRIRPTIKLAELAA